MLSTFFTTFLISFLYTYTYTHTCTEIMKAINSGDPASFMSRLPVHQDGSCNGLQHYAGKCSKFHYFFITFYFTQHFSFQFFSLYFSFLLLLFPSLLLPLFFSISFYFSSPIIFSPW